MTFFAFVGGGGVVVGYRSDGLLVSHVFRSFAGCFGLPAQGSVGSFV